MVNTNENVDKNRTQYETVTHQQLQDTSYREKCLETLEIISQVQDIIKDVISKDRLIHHSAHTSFTATSLDLKMLCIESPHPKDSITTLLNQKLLACQSHLDHLSARVKDRNFKILFAGDVNSGKSTIINNLLRRDVLPVDQQPCTSLFCQVTCAEEITTPHIHAIQDPYSYNQQDEDTFHTIELRHLSNVLSKHRTSADYQLLNIYLPPTWVHTDCLLLHNDVVNVALIDSPGLNADQIKTTSVFAREQDMDLVVCVVNAEAHLTLSTKEFLRSMSHERTHLLIAVNKFDTIHDKQRCKDSVLDQINHALPSTYRRAEELVHFISMDNVSAEYAKFEQALCTAVLHNRTQCKLLPVVTYLHTLLCDIHTIATFNVSKAEHQIQKSQYRLEHQFIPGYHSLIRSQHKIDQLLRTVIQSTTRKIEENTHKSLSAYVSDKELDRCVQSISYPGLKLTWQYAQNLADSLTAQLESHLQQIEAHTSHETANCISYMHDLVKDQLGEEVALTEVHQDRIEAFLTNRHRPLHIKVEARDLLWKRQLIDNKTWIMPSAITVCASTLCFSYLDVKGWLLSYLGRYINPFDDPHANLPSGRLIGWTASAFVAWGLGYTIYSFISHIPLALKTNLKAKFKKAIEDEHFEQNQAHRIHQAVQTVLETKQSDILSHLKHLIEEKDKERQLLKTEIDQSIHALHRDTQLAKNVHHLMNKAKMSLSLLDGSLK